MGKKKPKEVPGVTLIHFLKSYLFDIYVFIWLYAEDPYNNRPIPRGARRLVGAAARCAL